MDVEEMIRKQDGEELPKAEEHGLIAEDRGVDARKVEKMSKGSMNSR